MYSGLLKSSVSVEYTKSHWGLLKSSVAVEYTGRHCCIALYVVLCCKGLFGAAWCDVVQCGVVWCVVEYFGVVWCKV